MTVASLLVELLTEELPPKALPELGETFARQIHAGLAERGLVSADAAHEWFATPRRLALLAPGVRAAAPETTAFEKIMPVSVALDADGQPTPALKKKLAARGIPLDAVASFEKRPDGKSESFFHQAVVPGAKLDEVLSGIVDQALKKLPIPKVMRWGDSDHQFARPAHGLVMLHGERVVPGEVLGLASRKVTRGHRFLSSGEIAIGRAEEYADRLKRQGRVIVRFADRRAAIAEALELKAGELNAAIHPAEALLDEVTALVEWPVVYVGEFEAEYLAVPQECLILTMQQHQKYFPLLDAGKKLIHRFLIVSNMQVEDPRHIVGGNARVVRARLADARFFYDQDRKRTLESRIPALAKVVYHNRLGSQGERGERVTNIARAIAEKCGGGELTRQVEQAARLAKTDLLTDMVGEFPELQGTMGRYYALNDGLPPIIADAIEDHYKPRFAGDALPRSEVGKIAALADKLEMLAGMFSIGQTPTGDKDPFALRRHALGVIRILTEGGVDLPLNEALTMSIDGLGKSGSIALGGDVKNAAEISAASQSSALAHGVMKQPIDKEKTLKQLDNFIFDRYAVNLREQGYTAQEVDSVLSLRPQLLSDIPRRLAAVRAFARLPEADALAAANKRVGNILKKAGELKNDAPVPALFKEPAEHALFAALERVQPQTDAAFEAGDHTGSLKMLAALRAPVDDFFDQVMVNAEDMNLRANRLALLARLHAEMNRVADLSKLAHLGDARPPDPSTIRIL
jgi:glycyl-tRNA synthetase beta chain